MAETERQDDAATITPDPEVPSTMARVPWFAAKIRNSGGSKFELPVLDLSAGGCLVDVGFRAFKVEERVTVGLPGLAAVPAEVVWIEGQNAGIAFEHVLHEAVLENLIAARERLAFS